MAPEEVPMQWFIVEAANKPGELARHASAIAQRGINLSGVVSLGIGDRGGLAFYATDEAGVRSALNEAGIAFREVSVLQVQLEDKPGTLADAAKRLGDAGVNIELIAPTGMSGGKVTVAFGVDNPETASAALGDLVTSAASTGSRCERSSSSRPFRAASCQRVERSVLRGRARSHRLAHDAVEVVRPAQPVPAPAAAAIHDPVPGAVHPRAGRVARQLGPPDLEHPPPGGAVGPVLPLGARGHRHHRSPIGARSTMPAHLPYLVVLLTPALHLGEPAGSVDADR